MIVKMLTHVHMFAYTLWCWHTFEKEVEFEGYREDGFLSLSRRAYEAGFGAFRENEVHIFYCAGVSFGRSRGRNTHRTLATEAPDAKSERPVQTVPGPARVRHRTTDTGRRPVRPVVSIRCAGVLRHSLRMGPVSTGRYRCLASGDPQVCGTLYA